MVSDEDKQILTHLGAEIINCNRKSISHYYISNPDKTIRWIYPKSLKYPSFLNFYSASSIKAKILSSIIKILFKIKLGGFIKSDEFL